MAMVFKRAWIKPRSRPRVDVLFNPTEYRIEKGNQIAEIGVPGLGAPILQFVAGQSRTLAMELFFDTYEQQSDVRVHTDQVYNLLAIDPKTHAPPICDVTWGGFKFCGVLDKVSGSFTLFLPNGTPARAKLSVNFREYIEVSVLVREVPLQSSDHRKSRLVQAGDSLPSIAFEEYGEAGKWRPIAAANRIDDPRSLTPGRLLVIPAIQ
jgi:nucleoid-associated protein YgaU